MIGIYKIVNTVNNKIYIGSSIRIKIRMKDHLNLLRRNKHHSKHLQRSFNKYGEDKFKFIIILECKEEDLIMEEEYYIKYYKANIRKYGYNIESFSLGRKKRIFTKKWKENMSLAGSKYWDLYDLNNNIIITNGTTIQISKFLKCSTRTITLSYSNKHIISNEYIIVPYNEKIDYKNYNKLSENFYLSRVVKLKKPILLIKNDIKIEFESIKKAAEYLNCFSSAISQSLKKKCKVNGYNAYYK
jgi:group I intron endonuclease